jgi:hypothetical protein
MVTGDVTYKQPDCVSVCLVEMERSWQRRSVLSEVGEVKSWKSWREQA